jgi:hypothetical protein
VIAQLFTLMAVGSMLQTASLDTLRSAIDPNPALQSYTAAATLVARVHTLVPLQQRFTGTAYYVKPKQRIVFADVPPQLAQFRALDASVPTYAEASASYVIEPLANDGRASTYELVPKKTGSRVTSLVVTVGGDTGLIKSAVWKYANGGQLTFTQQYQTIGAYRLPSTINVEARFPGYTIDGVIQLTGYQTNVDVPNAVFTSEH